MIRAHVSDADPSATAGPARLVIGGEAAGAAPAAAVAKRHIKMAAPGTGKKKAANK